MKVVVPSGILERMRRHGEETPDQFKAAESAARKAGLQLVGIYHSHPDSPARPSEYDRDHGRPLGVRGIEA